LPAADATLAFDASAPRFYLYYASLRHAVAPPLMPRFSLCRRRHCRRCRHAHYYAATRCRHFITPFAAMLIRRHDATDYAMTLMRRRHFRHAIDISSAAIAAAAALPPLPPPFAAITPLFFADLPPLTPR
jgi:hypothetical protein